jgi:hypothetical protein
MDIKNKNTRINPYQTINSIGEMLSQSEKLNFKWIDFRGVLNINRNFYIGFQSQKNEKNALHISTFYDDYFGDCLNAISIDYWPHIIQRKGLTNLATLSFSH